MKRFILYILTILALSVSAAEVNVTSTLVITVNASGPLTADDKRGLQYFIGGYNEAIYATNGTPLPTNSAALLKSSAEQVISNMVRNVHIDQCKSAKSTKNAQLLIADPDLSAQITGAVVDAIVAGKPISKIITDITAP